MQWKLELPYQSSLLPGIFFFHGLTITCSRSLSFKQVRYQAVFSYMLYKMKMKSVINKGKNEKVFDRDSFRFDF